MNRFVIMVRLQLSKTSCIYKLFREGHRDS